MNLPNYYENLKTLHIGTMENRSYYIPYAVEYSAIAMPRERSERFQSLSGEWNFQYYKSVYDLPDDFYNVGSHDNDKKIPVPSVWQNYGYDKHQYTNICYPFPYDPPYVPLENPCGVYTREFELKNSTDMRHYLNFEGVDSCFYVWLNGEFVGYSQVSHSTSEFDVTKFVHNGNNKIVVLVLKWCSGSYFEDQDKFRMSGIFRDVYLLARPQNHIRDYFVKTELDETYTNAVVSADFSYSGSPIAVQCKLISPNGEVLDTKNVQNERVVFEVPNAQLWNAEHPALYTLILSSEDEVIAQKVGIRKIEIQNGVLLLNGIRIRFKGANRHDSDPVTGATISREQAMRDLMLMKEHNLNAIRTSHYPNSPWFTQLCDEFGFYVIDETDIECHGTTTSHGGEWMEENFSLLARDPNYAETILDRVQRNVVRDKNCPSVIMWSLGNESGYGENFEQAGRWVKQYDATRLVHYEGYTTKVDYEKDTSMLDVLSRMYPSLQEIEDYFEKGQKQKPYFLCEYIHAMGNGPGSIEEYFELMDKYPGFCGGFAWEWCDHAIYVGKTINGKPKYFYGGDFGEYPHDGNFCVDGLISPDRVPHTGLLEYKNVCRPVRAKLINQQTGEFEFTNRMDFTNLSDYVTVAYEITQNGDILSSGTLSELNIAPKSSKTIRINEALPTSGKSCIRFIYQQKGDLSLTKAGHLLGFDQIVLHDEAVKFTPLKADDSIEMQETETKIIVSNSQFTYTFNKLTGMFDSLNHQNKSLLRKPMEMNIWRAPTDNDRKIKEVWSAQGYSRAYSRAYSTHAEVKDGIAVIECECSLVAVVVEKILQIHACWRIDANGTIQAEMNCVHTKNQAPLPRFGVRLFLPKAMQQAEYFGYGPHESYVDKRQSTWLGKFATTTEQNYCDNIKPQENGSHYGCDYVVVTDAQGTGLRASSEKPFCFNLSQYTQEELDTKMHNFELEESDCTILCVDYAQNGIGSNSCGPELLPKYCFDDEQFTFRFQLEPVE